MTIRRFAGILFIAFSLTALAQGPASVDTAFQKFWAAHSPDEADKAIGEIVKSGVPFDEALKRLKAGRSYTAQKPGIVTLNNKTRDKVEHYYAVTVPEHYDPARRYQVRFQLHGGVGGRNSNQPRGNGGIGMLAGDVEQFYVQPYAWNEEPWWSDDQVLNLEAIIDSLKRTYNIDENRVVLSGVSDGGTGAYYVGMRDTTPFASFLPLNGFIMVLDNDSIDDGEMFPNNLRNKPMFAVNGGQDPLYPLVHVQPYVEHLMKGGVNIDFHPRPEAAHNTAWWPEIKGPYEQFVAAHPREAHPDKLTWETSNLSHNRAHWLIIDKLGSTPDDATTLNDLNTMKDVNPLSDFAFRAEALFYRPRKTGRVDLVKNGNTVEATTAGVTAITLLLSPDHFDFSQPIKVVANHRTVFEGRVEKNLETLLKWAARDNDRTMLYAAELKVKLTR